MAEKLEIYMCDLCGVVVEVLDGGAGDLVCCGEGMIRQQVKTEDAATEKHVPFIEQVDGGVKVRVGQNAAHPMEGAHYIQWIELLADGKAYRQFLNPGEAPEAVFPVTGQDLSAREYCNVHGLWQSE